MNLVIFDVDGTLIDSVGVDDRCFVQAFDDALGIRVAQTNWLEYQYQTDSGLALEIFCRHRGRRPTTVEVAVLENRFFVLLSRAIQTEPVAQKTGASRILDKLARRERWCPAIATGGWERTARLKLASVGIDAAPIPMATAGDCLERTAIIRTAVERAKVRLGVQSFASITYVGDAVWDARAAGQLGIAFLGVAGEQERTPLSAEGAQGVVPDFRDTAAFLRHLEEAAR